MRPALAGPASSHGTHKSPLDPGRLAGASQQPGNYRRVSTASGPTASAGTYTPTQDIGKTVAVGTSGDYRKYTVASGPQSSIANYTATTDIGKQAAAGNSGDYRKYNVAAGPQSSFGQYKATLDPGRHMPSAGGGSPAAFYSDHAGVAEVREEVPIEPTHNTVEKPQQQPEEEEAQYVFCATCGAKCEEGAQYCEECGGHI